jgi:hypothetical protein
MKPYQPSLIAPAGGLAILFLAVVLGGAAIGALVSLFSQQVLYLIVVFPIAMGLLAGYFVARAVHAGKIRNPGVAIAAAILAGLIVYATLWAVDYLHFRSLTALLSSQSSPTAAQVDDLMNNVLRQKTGQTGLIGYAMIRAQGADNHALVNLGPTFSWIYWVIELALILWMAVLVGRRPAYDPFCEPCNRWFGQQRLMGTLGASRSKEVLDLVNGGLFLKLGEELQSNPALPNLGVFMATPGADCVDGGAFLAVRKQSRGSGGNTSFTDLQSGLITTPQMQDLVHGVENRKALYGN